MTFFQFRFGVVTMNSSPSVFSQSQWVTPWQGLPYPTAVSAGSWTAPIAAVPESLWIALGVHAS